MVQKDTKTEHVRIKARPDSKVDLTEVKDKLAKLDPEATWFLHISKRMLLNGSTKNPAMRPSKLSLKKVIEVCVERGWGLTQEAFDYLAHWDFITHNSNDKKEFM